MIKKFMLLYKGQVTPQKMMNEEQLEASDSVRHEWIEKVGEALVDIGSSMVNGKALVDDGTVVQPSDLNGYSIIEAEDMDEALKLVDGNPFLMDKTGEFKVEVFELMSAPGV